MPDTTDPTDTTDTTDTPNPNTNAPAGYGTVTPWIISSDSRRLLDFLAVAFGATELARIVNEDGTIGHAEVRIGDSIVMMFDGRPEWGFTPAFLRLYVDDSRAVAARAVSAGATMVTEPTELAWGDRVGRVRDPQGNVWWLQERVEVLSFEAMQARATEPQFVDAMRYVQSATLVEPRPHEAG